MPQNELQKLANMDTTATSAWILNNTFAPLVIEQAQRARLLAGKAAATEIDHQAGVGDTVKIRFYPKRTAQMDVAEGATLDANADTLTTYSIQMKKHGDRVLLTGESILFTSDNVKARVISRMGDALARGYDERVYSKLKAAAPGSSKALAIAGDLVTSDDFALKLIDMVNEMRAGKDVIPDTVILGPDQIGALAKTKVTNVAVGAGIQMDANGRVVKFYGLDVVDIFSIANRNANTASMVQAIVIDSSRAFGEVYGKPPTYEEFRDAKSDTWDEVVWAWFNAGTLDLDGIGHLTNP